MSEPPRVRAREPQRLTSWTASVARCTLGKLQIATLVSSSGARRSVASVTMPSVPSAPMNLKGVGHVGEGQCARAQEAKVRVRATDSLVVSNPAELLRALLRVLMTSPLGRTTVCAGRMR